MPKSSKSYYEDVVDAIRKMDIPQHDRLYYLKQLVELGDEASRKEHEDAMESMRNHIRLWGW